MAYPPTPPPRYVMWPKPERAILARGSFGDVWRCKDEQQGVMVALKILRAADPKVQTRMEREAAVSAQIVHPNVITVTDMGRTPEGLPFLAFPLASNGTLRHYLGQPPPWPELLELLEDLLNGLSALHAHSVLHLDVKLDNVLLHRAGGKRMHLWLADLGVAVAITGDTTGDGMVAGTVGYMPAEQLAGQMHLWGPATDLFAFGALLYRLLCKDFPFSAKELVEAHAQRQHPPERIPIAQGYAVPKGLDQVLLALLQPHPLARYDCANDVLRALRALAPQESRPSAKPASAKDELAPDSMSLSLSSSAFRNVPTLQRPAVSAAPADLPRGVLPWHRPTPAEAPKRLTVGHPLRRTHPSPSLLIHRDLPLTAREAELETLWKTARWVQRKQRPALLEVIGPTGVGRSRLVRDFLRALVELGIAEGIHLPASRIRGQALRSAVRRIQPPPRADTPWADEFTTLLARDHQCPLDDVASAAAALANFSEHGTDESEAIDALREHLAGRAWRGLSYLWIEDAHLLQEDDPAWSLIDRIFRDPAPIAVVLDISSTAPMSQAHAIADRHARFKRRVDVAPLSDPAIAQLVQHALPVSDDIASLVAVHASGLPGAVRDWLVHLVAAGVVQAITEDTGKPRWVRPRGAPPPPRDRQDLARRRLAWLVAQYPTTRPALLAIALSDLGPPETVIGRVAGEALDQLVLDGVVKIDQGIVSLHPAELRKAVLEEARDPATDREYHRALAEAWAIEEPSSWTSFHAARHRWAAGELELSHDLLIAVLDDPDNLLPVVERAEAGRMARDALEKLGQRDSVAWTTATLALADALWERGQTAETAAVLADLAPRHAIGASDSAWCTALLRLARVRGTDAARSVAEDPSTHCQILLQAELDALDLAPQRTLEGLARIVHPAPEISLDAALLQARLLAARQPKEAIDSVRAILGQAVALHAASCEVRAWSLAAELEGSMGTPGQAVARTRSAIQRHFIRGQIQVAFELTNAVATAFTLAGLLDEANAANATLERAGPPLSEARTLRAAWLALLARDVPTAEALLAAARPMNRRLGTLRAGLLALAGSLSGDSVSMGEQALLDTIACGPDGVALLRCLEVTATDPALRQRIGASLRSEGVSAHIGRPVAKHFSV